MSQFAEIRKTYLIYAPHDIDEEEGIAYFRNVSTTTNIPILSGPVRVCLHDSSIHECANQNCVEVKKEEAFKASLVAVDQVGQPVSATIQAYLSSAESGLGEP